MDRYSARINLHGTTQRERIANRLKNNINIKANGSLSYKEVKLNGVDTYLIIDSGTQAYYKEYKSLPGQEINIGDYVEWANSHWIVFTCDSDDEFYRDGKLYQCNYLLKWQNEIGKIITRWAHIQSASKYNDGTTGNNIITLGSDQLSVIVPIDKETIKLKKTMGKKFFIDQNKQDPTVYELTGTGNVPDTYNGHGVTSWIVKEVAYTATKYDLMFGVCDYRKPNTPLPPTPKPNETTLLCPKIVGNPNLVPYFTRTYTANFKCDDKNSIKNGQYTWNVVSDFEVQQSIDHCNNIQLTVNNEDLIGSSFYLQLLKNGTVVSEFKITVSELM